VQLEADEKALISVYSPSGKIVFLEDSSERNLSQTLPESGFYEFVIVSTASAPIDYQLTVTAENPPESEPTSTDTPIPIPTDTPGKASPQPRKTPIRAIW
jgi:serine/threonine-protein kinase